MFEEFGLELDGHRRLYRLDLTKRTYNLDNTEPEKLLLDDKCFLYNAWTELIPAITYYLYSNSKITIEDLLKYRPDWSNAYVFSTTKKTNYKLICDGLFVSCNHTALHSIWFMQDLLQYFNVDLSKVTFLIRRRQIAEPKEIQEYFINMVKTDFAKCLKTQLHKTDKNVEIIVEKQFDHINNFQQKLSKSSFNFFLFDSYKTFMMYKTNFIKEYTRQFIVTKKRNVEIVTQALNYLQRYYYFDNY